MNVWSLSALSVFPIRTPLKLSLPYRFLHSRWACHDGTWRMCCITELLVISDRMLCTGDEEAARCCNASMCHPRRLCGHV